MLTSTFGVIMIVIGGLVALLALESAFVYVAVSPTWKTGRGASREGLHEQPELDVSPDARRELGSDARVPVGSGHN